ncbi:MULTISPECIES: response regulator transcription factor [Peptoniphilus]|uniref:response regulator transcription factor n=1 Tax=Peptoniphilus TaxID=162289 RepID=UPI0001DA9C11|nr:MULTISPECIES: response regulator transcription factor [Peptoniphilus]EFI42206.1 response regulator receiver domain protein [Peptoniphilus sp. oral taxon 386 str. F0131]
MNIKNRKILIVDDDVVIVNLVKRILNECGFKNIKCAYNIADAIKLFDREKFDIAILDILLPDGLGFDLIKYFRKNNNIPVLFLSAISDIENQYKSFMLGGDDYIVKPFLPKELELRLIAILNRSYGNDDNIVFLKNSKIDFEKALVIKSNKEIPLTAKEYEILKLLYENKNKIVTIDGILNSIWGVDSFGYENSLMAHIRKIREKVELNPSSPKNLLTFKGLGYKLKVET